MGRSAMHSQCASSSAESLPSPISLSPSSSNPSLSEPTAYEKPNRNSRRKGGKAQAKAGKAASSESDSKGKSRGSVPSQGHNSCDSSPSSRVPDDCSCAERPNNSQQAGAADSSPAESFMVREGYASHSLDTFIEHAKRKISVFSTFCKVRLTELSVEQKPRMDAFAARVMEWRCQVQGVIRHAWPFVRRALLITSGIVAALTLAWLNCIRQGCKSLLSLGSAAFCVVLCCTTLNLCMLGGFFKLFICLVFSAGAAFFVGYIYALVIIVIFSGLMLWLYGSFWFTGGVIAVGGILFFADQPRPALSVVLLYSVYSAKISGGWLGLFLCLNLSFVLSSLVIYFLHSNDTDSSAQDSTRTDGHANKSNKNRPRKGRPSEGSDATYFMDAQQDGLGTSRSTANGDGEASAVDKEVERLLSCKDHYAALELLRFAEVDLGSLKRDYKKKAMLVHPDKNLGNALAEEAFKRLQNAYEVLLDPTKKQSYDDELKREEVLSALKRFQQEVFRNGGAGTSDNWYTHSEDEQGEDLATRRVVCKKCNNTHRWICTNRDKLHARWCQECQDHHQAKDGDGWVEKKGQAFFFGMLQKVEVPQAYACADSKIYEVTEWVLCQGMKCIPNTHKPSFHVSTAGIFKSPPAGRGPRTSKSSPGNNADNFPFAHMNENMTEEEFRKWLENAMASGMFNDMNEAPEQEDAKSGVARAKPSKRKRKGKGKW